MLPASLSPAGPEPGLPLESAPVVVIERLPVEPPVLGREVPVVLDGAVSGPSPQAGDTASTAASRYPRHVFDFKNSFILMFTSVVRSDFGGRTRSKRLAHARLRGMTELGGLRFPTGPVLSRMHGFQFERAPGSLHAGADSSWAARAA